jgi:oligopeptide transport system substrate-binding protein
VKAARAGLAAVLAAVAASAGCSRRTSDVALGDREQILHRSIGVDLSDLDPHLAAQASDYSVLSALLEGLLAEDPVDLHPVPGVAERWDVAPDGLVYTFHLRADARWSNGRPVTSADFVASWRRILTPELGATTASQLYVIRGAEAFSRSGGPFSAVGLEAPDPRTLVVTLEHPAPWFPSVLSSPAWLPVPMDTLTRYGAATRRGNPWAAPGTWVGNGPFDLRTWRHGEEIVVARSPTYWDAEHVKLREIHFHAFDSLDSEERAFRAGQIHLTDALPPARIGAYRRDSPGLLRIDPLLGTYFFRINVRRLGDVRVRLALALAVDRSSIVGRILQGGQAPAYSLTPPGLQGYAPDPIQREDADEARRLLAEAGHPGGRGLPTYELLYNNSETHREIAEAVQQMWRRELGVGVRLVNEELKSTEEDRRTGSFDILRSSWIADYADPSAFLEMWRSDSGNNFTGWSSAAFDALLSSAARTSDRGARQAFYAQAERLLLREAPIITLFHYTHVFLIRASVQGWNPSWLDHHPYKGVWLRE